MNEPYAQPERDERRLPLVHRLLSVATTLLLLVGVVAAIAGKDTAGADPLRLLEAAPAAARDAGTARMAMTMHMKNDSLDVDLTASGLVDFKTGAGSFSIKSAALTAEMLMDGRTVWMKLPDATTAAVPELAGKWMSFPLPMASTAGSGVLGPNQATSLLDTLRSAGGTIVDLGDERVNDVDAHHYAVSIDLEQAIASLPEDQRAVAEGGLSRIGLTGRMPVDVWLNADGLPVRSMFDLRSSGTEMHVQMDLSDFGVPVHITPPPADQVVDISSQTTASFSASTTATFTAPTSAP